MKLLKYLLLAAGFIAGVTSVDAGLTKKQRQTRKQMRDSKGRFKVKRVVVQEACYVCLEPVYEGDEVAAGKIFDCSHVGMHRMCTAKWAAQSGDTTCPVCRAKQSDEASAIRDLAVTSIMDFWQELGITSDSKKLLKTMWLIVKEQPCPPMTACVALLAEVLPMLREDKPELFQQVEPFVTRLVEQSAQQITQEQALQQDGQDLFEQQNGNVTEEQDLALGARADALEAEAFRMYHSLVEEMFPEVGASV